MGALGGGCCCCSHRAYSFPDHVQVRGSAHFRLVPKLLVAEAELPRRFAAAAAASRHHIVQHSTNRADSLCESLYLVQYFIVRLYVKQLP